MLGFTVRTKSEMPKVRAKARRANFTSLGQAGAAIRLTARRSIRRRKTASPAGQPPHTRKGQLKRAIGYAVEEQAKAVVVGPEAEAVGESGRAHEIGGLFRRERYPRRPFMRPALEKLRSRLPRMWANSVR